MFVFQLPHLEFALNHHGDPDVALFDFTSMFAAGFASHVMEKNQKQLLFSLVGDGLLEPFWPTGTGCPRGALVRPPAGGCPCGATHAVGDA